MMAFLPAKYATFLGVSIPVSQRKSQPALGNKFGKLYTFSDEKKQSINIEKTLFLHMNKTPDTEPISCGTGDIIVKSLEVGKSAPYLGLYLIHTNKLREIIEFNS